MTITLDYLDTVVLSGTLVALGWIAKRAMDNAELRDLRAFAAAIDEIDQGQITGRTVVKPVVSDPATALAVVEPERVGIADRARNTLHAVAAALGKLVLPLVALAALVVSPITDWWRDRRVIDVEPELLPVSEWMPEDEPTSEYTGKHWVPDTQHTGQIPRVTVEPVADVRKMAVVA